MNPYEAIFVRKSVRQFQEMPLTEEDKQAIQEYIGMLLPLYGKENWEIVVSENSSGVEGKFKVEAPAYVVFLSDTAEPEDYYNAGYLLENLLLYLQTRNIGSCYQGGVQWIEREGIDGYVRMVAAIGYGVDSICRERKAFKRKPLRKLVTVREDYDEEVAQMLEAARLAPSALNTQPWHFVVYHNRIHFFIKNGKEQFPMHLVDMGICMAHMALAAEEAWIDVDFAYLESVAEKKVRKYQYVSTMMIQ